MVCIYSSETKKLGGFIGWEQDERDRDRMALVVVCIMTGKRGKLAWQR